MDGVLVIFLFAIIYLASVAWHAGADYHTKRTTLSEETTQMKHSESEVYELIDACNENINSGDVNAAASYDEGVRDALLWLIDGTPKPEIGREI